MLVLAVIFGLSYLARPLIPEPEPNVLIQASGEFVRAGARQQIQWRLDLVDAFEDARTYDKPVMVVAGHRLSEQGRRLDMEAFTDPEVIEKVNLRVIPVRVDLAERPEWEDGILPLTRLSLGARWGLDVAVFLPDGRLIAWPSLPQLEVESAEDWMLDMLADLPQLLRENSSDLALLQLSEVAVELARTEPETINLEDYADDLLNQASDANGGIPINGRQEPLLWEWQAMVTSDRIEAADFSLQRLLEGEIVDWLHGGIFYETARTDWTEPNYNKSAVQNADFAALLARMAAWRGDEQYRMAAEWMADSVVREFSREEGFAGWSYGLREADGRCLRYCLPAQVVLSREFDTPFLRDRLGLNPLGGPLVADIADWRARFRSRRVYEPVLWRLRDRTDKSKVEYGQLNDAAVVGTVAARLMETGMILGSETIARQGRDMLAAMKFNEAGRSDIVKQDGSAGDLRDYLAFADAAYWRWMTLQDQEALFHGEAVLRRAMTLFLDRETGLMLPRAASIEVPGAPVTARWTDGVSRSEVATAIRLLDLYASTLGQTNLKDTARIIARHYAPVANRAEYRVGGLMDAIHRLEQGAVLACVGQLADSAWRRQMAQWPMIDVVVSVQRGITPGVYRVDNAKIAEPWVEPGIVGPAPAPGS